jgi:predicted PurR-regulated permease PerM
VIKLERKVGIWARAPRLSIVLVGTVIACLLVGGILGYAVSSFTTSSQIHDLQGKVSTLQEQISDPQSAQNSSSQNSTYQTSTIENNIYLLGENVSLSRLYEQVKSSVVVIQGTTVTEYYYPWGAALLRIR